MVPAVPAPRTNSFFMDDPLLEQISTKNRILK